MEEIDDARQTVNWLKIACQKREAERERCYQAVYKALVTAESVEVVEALQKVAFEIIDPK